MNTLTDQQMKYMSSIYNIVGDRVMLKAFPVPKPLEIFEFDTVMYSTDPATGDLDQRELDRAIAAFGRIAMALERWRREKDNKFDPDEEIKTFQQLLFLSAGERMEEEHAEIEAQLLEYLEHPVGE
jgi:hypothetical protein